jgi:acyl-CoA hydrolase
MVDVPRQVAPPPKKVAESQTTLVQLMEITHANISGIVHGGEVMKLVDTAAGIASIKHAGGMCVTVSMDEMSFLHPVHVGDLVTVMASVNDVGTTSLEIGVRVEVEDVITGERMHTSSAYLVFVALDEEGRPRPVPEVIAEGAAQKRRQREAKMRRETRLAHRKAIESHRAEAGEPTEARERRPPIHMPPEDPGARPHLRM